MMDMFENTRADRKFARCRSSHCEIIGEIVGGIIGGITGGGDSTQKVNADPWKGVQEPLRDLYAGVQSAYGNALPYYPNVTYAPFNPLQIGGQYATLDYAQNRFQPGVGTLQTGLQRNINQQLNPAATNPWAGHFQTMFNAPSQIANNPYLNQMMQNNARNVTDNLLRNALPSIRSNAAMAGQYGGSRQGIAEGLAIGEAAKGLADSSAKLQSNAWNTGMQQRGQAGQLMANTFGNQLTGSLDAMRMMPNALQLGFMGPQYAMDIGNLQQGQYQRSIDEQMARYYYPERRTWEMLSDMSGIYSGASPYASQTTTTPGNPLGSALGGMAIGNSLWNNWNSNNTPSLTSGTPVVANSGVNSFNYVPSNFFGS